MQVQASVSDINGDLLRDNLSFTTFQVKDGNTGRPKAPTSGVAMNQTMPHTVRPAESRGCETCHSLMNDQGQVRNEAIMNQTMGIGTGALPYLGDWVFAAGTNGLELFEHKEEKELAAVKANPLSTSHRFPGLIMDPGNNVSRVDGKVEPIQVGAVGTDVVLIRNFNAEPVRVPSTLQAELAPTLRDLAVLGLANGTVQIIDVSERGHPTAVTRPAVGNQSRVTNINIPGANAVTGLAHMGSDVSDPFVYVATDTGVVTLKIGAPPNIGVNGQNFVVDQLTLTGKSPTAIAIGGDRLYVGTANGTIEVISVDTPNDPVLLRSIALPGAPVVNGMNLSGFTLYLATTAGTAAVNLENPDEPGPLLGLSQIQYVGGPSQGVYAFQGIVFAAAGPQGVLQIDYKTPAAPINLGTIGGGNAVDVVVSRMPGQVWVISLNSVGNVHYTKLNNQDSPKEVCFPNPAAAGCTLDMEFRDMTAQSTRDPSFNPANGQFDVLDPSHQSFVQVRRILGGGQRMARPTLIEQLNTLTGRRYRDSFMPGSGTISLEVMQRMRQVQVCETETPGNDPAGLNELGYFLGPGQCVPFGASAKPRKVCRIEHVGGPEVCKLEPIHVDPATLPGVFAAKTRRHVAPGRLVPAAAPNAPLVPVTQPNPVSSKPPPAAIPVTAAPAAAASVGASAR
jgi:hypothetical protein